LADQQGESGILDHEERFTSFLDVNAGLEITADQRSMIGRKLFLIGEEAGLPFILIGRNIFDHCLKDMLIPVRGKRQIKVT
jgi:hypothetical protein